GRRGEGEVRVAAGVEEHAQLGIDPAVAAVAARVREAPVAGDGGVAGRSLRAAGQVTVLGERLQIGADAALEALGVVRLVVQVELDLAVTLTGEAREGVQVGGRVLLAGKEEGVPG